MYKKFSDKISAPTANQRVSREAEQRAAHVTELCRGNELFDKADYLAALAEYEVAADKPQLDELAPFAHLNRGNCYKALSFRPQASAAYRQVIDATAALRTPAEKLLHACALNNLGAVCKDGGRLEQALQHFSATLALFPRSHLALKNLAEVHMVYARQLGEADLKALGFNPGPVDGIMGETTQGAIDVAIVQYQLDVAASNREVYDYLRSLADALAAANAADTAANDAGDAGADG